jgi:hypothetical protein
LRPIIFDVRVNGKPIDQYNFRSGVSTGVTYGSTIHQLVPPYEEHEVRVLVGYTLTEWAKLEPEERALEVAHYRIRVRKKMVEDDVIEAINKRNSRGRK